MEAEDLEILVKYFTLLHEAELELISAGKNIGRQDRRWRVIQPKRNSKRSGKQTHWLWHSLFTTCTWRNRAAQSKPVITVKEARKLLGKDGKNLTDEQVQKLILDLEFIARHTIRKFYRERGIILPEHD